MPRWLLLTALVLGTFSIARAEPASLQAAAADAISEDAEVAAAAIARLRSAGPAGLTALFDAHRALLALDAATEENLLKGGRPAVGPAAGSGDPRRSVDDPNRTVDDARRTNLLARLRAAIDAVGAQRDCDASRLYWYTDLNSAIDAARHEGKPILSLRLLGKLTDEFSCANSRYFRTSLYANRKIGDYLRAHFILHWQTFRPVPRVTIDYGDGRKLERTLTGNSIHYVLDTEGRPFDALPGLYGPQAFLRELQQIEAAVVRIAGLGESASNDLFLSYHQQRVKSIQTAWQRDLAALKIAGPPAVAQSPNSVVERAPPQKKGNGAVRAGALAQGKGVVEFPVLNALALNAGERFRWGTDDVWSKIGARHQNDAILDDASVALIRRQNPAPAISDPQNGQSPSPEEALSAMVQAFQISMTADTVRNEYELHRLLHEWFALGIDRDLESLNDRVYTELFLTPRSDAWLGLVAPEVYTGLENGGKRE
jgi:hypothetical protein